MGGGLPVMGLGLLLQASCMFVCLAGTGLLEFYLGLCLLGLGWNLAFVSGTLLLIKSHTVPERTKVTSANETLRFAANGAAVLLSSTLQWEHLMYICLVALLPVGAVILQQGRRREIEADTTPGSAHALPASCMCLRSWAKCSKAST